MNRDSIETAQWKFEGSHFLDLRVLIQNLFILKLFLIYFMFFIRYKFNYILTEIQ
jgi:hypothetical protein